MDTTPISKSDGIRHPVCSMCPECLQSIAGEVVAEGEQVVMRKACAEHGAFECVVAPDAEAYGRMQGWQRFEQSPARYAKSEAAGCPDDCGLCPAHEQHTCLAILEITSRCNLGCPVCLSASTTEGVDMTVDQVASALGKLLDSEGAPVPLQLAGGEPTQHPHLIPILRQAREMGFQKIELDSNGLLLAKHPDLAAELREAGLGGVYLQMDGTEPEAHDLIRGRDLTDEKMRAIENCQAAGLQLVLSVTLVPGVNEDGIWDMIRFAAGRGLTGINFQSVVLSGRYPQTFSPGAQRFTAGHFMRRIEAQSGGELRATDLMPMSCPDPRCGLLAYVIVTRDGELVPVNRLLGDEAMLEHVAEFTDWEILLRQIGCQSSGCGCGDGEDPSNQIAQLLDGAECFSIGFHGMMDAYCFDEARARRCCVHKLTTDGRLMPFCLYNMKYRPRES
ncbi:MAG: radical SAM protein [Rhodospirillales bacterium]|nr:radical SAM protein [Rhodospirillales bacterium]